jgi:hypothetical protein
MKTFCTACLLSIVLLFSLTGAQSLSGEKTELALEMPPEYKNYASEGTYMNPAWVGEVPEWHYYDVFGNQLLDGFYLFGMSMGGTANTGKSSVSLHPFLKKWLNGMVQVGDLSDNHGLLVMIGDRVKTHFTPYTFNQSLFCGARVDGFFNFLGGENSVSIINSRISNSGIYGMFSDNAVEPEDADWLHGIHLKKNYKDILEFGGTLLNIHSQVANKGNSFGGALKDSFPESTPTALSIFGFDGRFTFPTPDLIVCGEYAQSREILGGDFNLRPGNLAVVNSRWNVFDALKFGGEGYLIESRYKTTFTSVVHPDGDVFGSGKYLYSLIEDNDDGDDYPENGKSKLNAVPEGDPDGTYPVAYDKDKNGRLDYEEDFLSYDADPPKSTLYFDRNNNSVPDVIEDDPYPDYPYVPSYFLPGERCLKYDEMNGKTYDDTSDGMVSKGLLGFHLYGSYQILPKINLTLGFLSEKSEKSSFQMTYQDTMPVGLTFAQERASNIYSLIEYRNDLSGDKKLTINNYFRIIKDNIPNHTQSFILGKDTATGVFGSLYTTVEDELDYRDALNEMLIAEFSIYKTRGFNLTTRGKFEFQKNFPHLVFNYPEANIFSTTLVNKCEYIYLLPFLKDMFLIPKYKNLYNFEVYGPYMASIDGKYKQNSMTNAAYLVYEWKCTLKTSITTGLQFSTFNDNLKSDENFYHGNWTLQLMLKDRYAGLNMILTMGFAKYKYTFYNSKSPEAMHNPFNNPHRITSDISSYNLFMKVHCGF